MLVEFVGRDVRESDSQQERVIRFKATWTGNFKVSISKKSDVDFWCEKWRPQLWLIN
jgi:hypothetical protein